MLLVTRADWNCSDDFRYRALCCSSLEGVGGDHSTEHSNHELHVAGLAVGYLGFSAPAAEPIFHLLSFKSDKNSALP